MPLPAGHLLDTNIVVALVRGNAFGKYLEATFGISVAAPGSFLISIVTVGELYALSTKFGWGPVRRNAVASFLSVVRWVDISDPPVLLSYADLDAATDRMGRPMGKNDVWIAAIARATNRTLLTSDTDFDHLQGGWIDREWVDPSSRIGP